MDLNSLNERIALMESTNPELFYSIIFVFLVWKLVWYGLALYRTINRKQEYWFVILFICPFVLNDLGILPIIYLAIYRDKKQKIKAPDKGKK